jgi:prevent-host-death family protein
MGIEGHFPGRRGHSVGAADFKARCLALMDEVERTGAEVVITKHGRAVAKLVPVNEEPAAAHGWLRGTVRRLAEDGETGTAWGLDESPFPER